MTSYAAGGVQAKPAGLITREAARDLSSYQYHAVKIDANGRIDYADTSNGDIAIGILQNAPDQYEEAEVATRGTSLMSVDGNAGAITGGASLLGSEATSYDGVAVSGDKDFFFAIAIEDSDADGDLIEVLIVGPGYIGA
jgi:hypothetical protein